jgi:UDP-glucose 4-epimerase
VYGDDYATADGTPIRDYIHVSDLADAHVASVQRLMQGGSSGAFNLGTGRGYSVKQVLDAISAEAHDRLEVGRGPRRPGGPPILVADAALAGAELGFKPRQSDLKTIIATAWAWHRRAHPKKGTSNGSAMAD